MDITLLRDGRQPLDLSAYWQTARFASAAVGGFADASLVLPGGITGWRRELQYLGLLRITEGPKVLWEGQLEEVRPSLEQVEIRAFGLRRRLEQTSVKRIWSLRAINWEFGALAVEQGGNLPYFGIQPGAFDSSDLTKFGFRLVDSSGPSARVIGNCSYGKATAPAGITFTRVMCTVARVGVGYPTDSNVHWLSSTDGSTWTSEAQSGVALPASFDQTLTAGTRFLRMGYRAQTATANTGNFDFYGIRILGTSLTEDASGGFFGGTILRDLIALVPDLAIGTIDTDSDFTIEAIERSIRNTALSVVEEVAGYYPREWAVWEDGRFDWKTVNFDEPQWTIGLADVDDLELVSSVDNIARTVYLSYVDATTLETKEVTATSTDQRNPFVTTAKAKDAVAQPSFLLTQNSAQQLANRLVADQGGYPSVSGRIVLPIGARISSAVGPARPAYQLRGGENILIHDLPKTDPLRPGRDGETLFHIASAEVNMGEGKVTLEVEGYQRRADILLARLASATRTVTG